MAVRDLGVSWTIYAHPLQLQQTRPPHQAGQPPALHGPAHRIALRTNIELDPTAQCTLGRRNSQDLKRGLTMLHELRVPTRVQSVPNDQAPMLVAGALATSTQGLYLFLFENTTELNVYDNPNDAVRRKVIIHGRGLSLKAGKFEQGFLVRLTNYSQHLHRRPQDRTEWAFLDSFRGGYLFDMTHGFEGVRNPAAVFERYWIECINAFAEHRSLLQKAQKARSEWRHLRAETWSEEMRTDLASYAGMDASKVRAMAAIAPIPVRAPIETVSGISQ